MKIVILCMQTKDPLKVIFFFQGIKHVSEEVQA